MAVTQAGDPEATAAPEWLRGLVSARSGYERRFGWPVVIDAEHQRLAVVVGNGLDALIMPATLGQHVLDELRISMLAGPVISDPTRRWWTFLTLPAPRLKISAELPAQKIRLVPRGAPVILPAVTGDASTPQWIVEPCSGPPWSVVVGATRRCINNPSVNRQRSAADGPSGTAS